MLHPHGSMKFQWKASFDSFIDWFMDVHLHIFDMLPETIQVLTSNLKCLSIRCLSGRRKARDRFSFKIILIDSRFQFFVHILPHWVVPVTQWNAIQVVPFIVYSLRRYNIISTVIMNTELKSVIGSRAREHSFSNCWMSIIWAVLLLKIWYLKWFTCMSLKHADWSRARQN